jgi:hypothetical protein
MCRPNLVTINVPLLDNTTRCRYEVLGVCGGEDNIGPLSLLFYDTMALPCLNVPQTNCLVKILKQSCGVVC